MIKLKGTTIYPPAINDVLDNTPFVGNYVVVVRHSDAGTDEVIVRVSLRDFIGNDEAVKQLKEVPFSLIILCLRPMSGVRR